MTGEFRNKIDEKGRLMIPPKFREQMGDLSELYLTRSNNYSVWLFTKEGYEKLSSVINDNPLAALDPNVSMIRRMIIDPARQVELDKTGRVTIPEQFRKTANIELKKECVILGSGDKLEILGAEAYDRYFEENMMNLNNAGSVVSKMSRS